LSSSNAPHKREFVNPLDQLPTIEGTTMEPPKADKFEETALGRFLSGERQDPSPPPQPVVVGVPDPQPRQDEDIELGYLRRKYKGPIEQVNIRLPYDLAQEVRDLAAEQEWPIKDIYEAALRLFLRKVKRR
jgi:hypothetical protein